MPEGHRARDVLFDALIRGFRVLVRWRCRVESDSVKTSVVKKRANPLVSLRIARLARPRGQDGEFGPQSGAELVHHNVRE